MLGFVFPGFWGLPYWVWNELFVPKL